MLSPPLLHPTQGSVLVQFFQSASRMLEEAFRPAKQAGHAEEHAEATAAPALAREEPQLLEFAQSAIELSLGQLAAQFGPLEADVRWDALDEQTIEQAEILHPLFLRLADLMNANASQLGPLAAFLEPLNAWEQRLELLSQPELHELFQRLERGEPIHEAGERVEWKKGMLTW